MLHSLLTTFQGQYFCFLLIPQQRFGTILFKIKIKCPKSNLMYFRSMAERFLELPYKRKMFKNGYIG